jgi:hypothetical protein
MKVNTIKEKNNNNRQTDDNGNDNWKKEGAVEVKKNRGRTEKEGVRFGGSTFFLKIQKVSQGFICMYVCMMKRGGPKSVRVDDAI